MTSIYQDDDTLARHNIMKKANDGKVFSRHLQLPLGFERTDPGDFKQILAFLDDRSSLQSPVFLSEVFSRFLGQPHAWSGSRISRCISGLFSDHLISCVADGNTFLPDHSSVFLEMPDQWEQIQVIARKRLTSGELEMIVDACQQFFGMDCPPDQDDLTVLLDGRLRRWNTLLAGFDRLAETGQYPGVADIRACLSFVREWLSIADPYEKIRAVRDRSAALASFSRTAVRLQGFFENGIVRWESWRKSLRKFTEFQFEIESYPDAGAGLSKLRHVLEMQSPWDELNGMETLIARINPVYDRIREDKCTRLQQDTLCQINRMIETISELLDDVHASDALRNTALLELQKIRKTIELDKPGALISRQREIAEEAFEKAQDVVLSQC